MIAKIFDLKDSWVFVQLLLAPNDQTTYRHHNNNNNNGWVWNAEMRIDLVALSRFPHHFSLGSIGHKIIFEPIHLSTYLQRSGLMVEYTTHKGNDTGSIPREDEIFYQIIDECTRIN